MVQPDGEAALAWSAEPDHHADVVLLDVCLPGMSCLELLEILQTRYTLPSILITSQGDEVVAALAMNLGAIDYIIKEPGYVVALPAVIQYAHVLAAYTALQQSCASTQDSTSD